MKDQNSGPGNGIYGMTKDEIAALSKEEFDRLYRESRLFTVRDAIEWLSKQDPDAGLMYFEINSNAWCDMSPDMFCTVAEERERETRMQLKWHSGDADKARREIEEVFRYVKETDVCVRS